MRPGGGLGQSTPFMALQEPGRSGPRRKLHDTFDIRGWTRYIVSATETPPLAGAPMTRDR